MSSDRLNVALNNAGEVVGHPREVEASTNTMYSVMSQYKFLKSAPEVDPSLSPTVVSNPLHKQSQLITQLVQFIRNLPQFNHEVNRVHAHNLDKAQVLFGQLVRNSPARPQAYSLEQLKLIYERAPHEPDFESQAQYPVMRSLLNHQVWEKYASLTSMPQYWLKALKFGFQLGVVGPTEPAPFVRNGSSALEYPEHVRKYISEQKSNNSLAGPLNHQFITGLILNPIITREKKNSTARRIIIDMSQKPSLMSPNANTPAGVYRGKAEDLVLPTPYTFRDLVRSAGPEAYMYALDLKSAYKQIKLWPRDWIYTGLQFEGEQYVDISLPFGSRNSIFIMQSTLQFALQIVQKLFGITNLGYIDDTGSACSTEMEAWVNLTVTLLVLTALGLEIAAEKLVTPTVNMVWLGVTYDSVSQCMFVPKAKVQELIEIAKVLSNKQSVQKQQFQSFVGKLMHLVYIVPQLKVVACRMFDALRGSHSQVTVNMELKLDLQWLIGNSKLLSTTAPLTPRLTSTHKIVVEGGSEGFTVKLANTIVARKQATSQGQAFLKLLPFLLKKHHQLVRNKEIRVVNRSKVYMAVLNSGRASSSQILRLAREHWSTLVQLNVILIAD